jgi:hypothetical protein
MRYWNKLTGCLAYESDSDYLKAVEQDYLNDDSLNCSFREYVESDDAFYTDYNIIATMDGEQTDKVLENLCTDVTSTENGYVMSDGYVLSSDSDATELFAELCDKYSGVSDDDNEN